MNIALSSVQNRMLQRGTTKLVWFSGEMPLLFDLKNGPDESANLTTDSRYTDILLSLNTTLFERLDPDAIEIEMHPKVTRRRVIRNWVASARTSEPMRWFDPNPERNRYE